MRPGEPPTRPAATGLAFRSRGRRSPPRPPPVPPPPGRGRQRGRRWRAPTYVRAGPATGCGRGETRGRREGWRSRSGQGRDVGNWEALPSERLLLQNAVVQSRSEVCGVSSSPGRRGGAAGPRGGRGAPGPGPRSGRRGEGAGPLPLPQLPGLPPRLQEALVTVGLRLGRAARRGSLAAGEPAPRVSEFRAGVSCGIWPCCRSHGPWRSVSDTKAEVKKERWGSNRAAIVIVDSFSC